MKKNVTFYLFSILTPLIVIFLLFFLAGTVIYFSAGGNSGAMDSLNHTWAQIIRVVARFYSLVHLVLVGWIGAKKLGPKVFYVGGLLIFIFGLLDIFLWNLMARAILFGIVFNLGVFSLTTYFSLRKIKKAETVSFQEHSAI